jgi:type II secretory pathway component PulM
MKKIKMVSSVIMCVFGVLTVGLSAAFWILLAKPLRESAVAAEKNVAELRGSLTKFAQECESLPQTAQATRQSMASSAAALAQMNKSTQAVVDQFSNTLVGIKSYANIMKTMGDRCHGFADSTAKVPIPFLEDTAKEFHQFRAMLYDADKSLQTSAKDLREMTNTLAVQVKEMKPVLDRSLKDTSSALVQISKQIESSEANVLPTIPRLLEATTKDLEASTAFLRMVSPIVGAGCLLFLFVGIISSASGLRGFFS